MSKRGQGINHWLTTDTHFGHKQMAKYCKRPDKFEDIILTNLSVIPSGDGLYHLGDFCIGNDEHWHSMYMDSCDHLVNILIKGNHDRKSTTWYYNHGWSCVCDSLNLNLYKKDILLSHKPSAGSFDINIHGHHHNTLHHPEDEVTEKHKLIFIEHEYTPFLLRDIVV